VSSRAAVPWWILAYGAVALDIGLLTYGHHIMRALGNKIWYATKKKLPLFTARAHTHTQTHAK
jgi:sodium-dependent phosphate transporter